MKKLSLSALLVAALVTATSAFAVTDISGGAANSASFAGLGGTVSGSSTVVAQASAAAISPNSLLASAVQSQGAAQAGYAGALSGGSSAAVLSTATANANNLITSGVGSTVQSAASNVFFGPTGATTVGQVHAFSIAPSVISTANATNSNIVFDGGLFSHVALPGTGSSAGTVAF